MLNLVLPIKVINAVSLDEQFRRIAGSALLGMASDARNLTLYFDSPIDAATAQRITDAYASHDPSQLTTEQIAEKQRIERLAQLRQADATLDADGLALNQADVRRLARKVLRLEAEIEALRKGE